MYMKFFLHGKSVLKLLLFLSFVFIVLPSGKNYVPLWVGNKEAVYPRNEFLSVSGTGSTVESARMLALNTLSMTFKTQTKIFNDYVSVFVSSSENGKSSISKNEELVQNIDVISDAEFYCVEFSDSYFDKKQGKYTVIAYINRQKAALYYESRIKPLLLQMYNSKEISSSVREPLHRIMELQNAVLLGKLAESFIQNSIILNDYYFNKYEKDLAEIANIKNRFEKEKNKITFSVRCAHKRGQPVITGLASILEQSGFISSRNNPSYVINVKLDFIEEKYEAGDFVRPVVNIEVSDMSGRAVSSYSKNHVRCTHSSMELAYTRAIHAVIEDLDENFLIEYRGL